MNNKKSLIGMRIVYFFNLLPVIFFLNIMLLSAIEELLYENSFNGNIISQVLDVLIVVPVAGLGILVGSGFIYIPQVIFAVVSTIYLVLIIKRKFPIFDVIYFICLFIISMFNFLLLGGIKDGLISV